MTVGFRQEMDSFVLDKRFPQWPVRFALLEIAAESERNESHSTQGAIPAPQDARWWSKILVVSTLSGEEWRFP